jgi:tRNA nucleotidyltransferase (CCA-adding enzyme)
MGVTILVGHSNLDLDSLGSIALGRYLYPDAVPIKSRLIHPVARNIYTLYKDHLNMSPSRELKHLDVDKMVVFDTRSIVKLGEYLDFMKPWNGDIELYDHHSGDSNDFPDAVIHQANYGANTTVIAELLIEKNIDIDERDATIALTGIFADTGNFTHDNITAVDFKAANWLLEQGANIKLVRNFLKILKQDYQIDLFHQVVNSIILRKVHGHTIMFGKVMLPDQMNGMNAVVEKAMEIENPDAMFVVFEFAKKKRTLVVGRSQSDDIDVSKILGQWNGGGHSKAAAATVKSISGALLLKELMLYLYDELTPAVNASDIMTKEVESLNCNWSMMECSLYLEKVLHTGGPVINDDNKICGFLTLRDISKARKAGQMGAPAKSYMSSHVYSGREDSTIRELENFFLTHNVGHIPIINNSEEVVGIVTRSDYLRVMS